MATDEPFVTAIALSGNFKPEKISGLGTGNDRSKMPYKELTLFYTDG